MAAPFLVKDPPFPCGCAIAAADVPRAVLNMAAVMAADPKMAALVDVVASDEDGGCVAGPAAVTAAYEGDSPAAPDVREAPADGVVAGGVSVNVVAVECDVGGREDVRLRDDAPADADADGAAAEARVRTPESPPTLEIVLCAPRVPRHAASVRGTCSLSKWSLTRLYGTAPVPLKLHIEHTYAIVSPG